MKIGYERFTIITIFLYFSSLDVNQNDLSNSQNFNLRNVICFPRGTLVKIDFIHHVICINRFFFRLKRKTCSVFEYQAKNLQEIITSYN